MRPAKQTPYVEQRFDCVRGLDGITDDQIADGAASPGMTPRAPPPDE